MCALVTGVQTCALPIYCFRGMLSMIRSLYLAGPDVFRPDARERGRELKALCAQFGIEGLFPLDQEVPVHLVDPGEQAAWIYRANIRSEEHTSELQSLMRISYAVFCLKKNNMNKLP